MTFKSELASPFHSWRETVADEWRTTRIFWARYGSESRSQALSYWLACDCRGSCHSSACGEWVCGGREARVESCYRPRCLSTLSPWSTDESWFLLVWSFPIGSTASRPCLHCFARATDRKSRIAGACFKRESRTSRQSRRTAAPISPRAATRHSVAGQSGEAPLASSWTRW